MTDSERAWLAGFFDGEGCITLRKSKRHGDCVSPVYSLAVTISQKGREIIDYIGCLVGFGSITNNRRDYWQILFTDNQAHDFLKMILQYTKRKKCEAEVAIQFQHKKKRCAGFDKDARRGKIGKGLTVPQNELAWRDMYYHTLKYLKTPRSWPCR